MKKAKIMLMAIAVLAVVGGSLAFKAHNFTLHPFFACTSIQGVTINGNQAYGCTLPVQSFYTTLNPTIAVANITTVSQAVLTTLPCAVGAVCSQSIRVTQ